MNDAFRSPRSSPPLYLFLLWAKARAHEERILADLRARFTVLDVAEIRWTGDETFARSLSRMYGSALPPGSDKEQHCGTGPMLAVVVMDVRPVYRLRRTNRGRRLLNAGVFDARARYREWTGGGHRVHASDCRLETEQNLLLLLGTRTAEMRARHWAGGVRVHDEDPVGTHGWSSPAQLIEILEAYHCWDVALSPDGRRIDAATIDVWWAAELAGGARAGEPDVCDVQVAGKTVELHLRPSSKGRGLRSLLR